MAEFNIIIEKGDWKNLCKNIAENNQDLAESVPAKGAKSMNGGLMFWTKGENEQQDTHSGGG